MTQGYSGLWLPEGTWDELTESQVEGIGFEQNLLLGGTTI